MKTKIIPFDLETAKKIQAGEIKGRIQTRTGNCVRIICWDKGNEFPIVSLIRVPSGGDILETHLINGSVSKTFESNRDLFLEVTDDEPQFKPFDRVLVRDADSDFWRVSFFSNISDDWYLCVGEAWMQCIPYEGNEHLVGTINNPE